MLTQLSRLALTDGTDTVNLINISEGVDGAARFGYDVESTEIIIDGGDTKTLELGHTFQIVTLWDSDHKAQLSTWEQAKTPLQLSGYGVDGFVYWHDPVIFVYADTPAGSSQVFWIKATRTTPPGYDDAFRKTGGIQASKNLLGIYDREQGSSTLMAGTSLTGEPAAFIPRVFTAPDQELELGSTPSVPSYFNFLTETGDLDFVFPHPGATVTLSVNVVAHGGTFRLFMDARNVGGSTISTVNQAIAGTGVTSLSFTLPAGTYSVRAVIDIPVTGGAQDGDGITFNRPSLNIGSTRNYSRF